MSKLYKSLALVLALVMTMALLAGCGGSGKTGGAAAPVEVLEGGYTFPLAEKAEISGITRYPANTESEPNNRTIYKRLEEATNVHVNWKTIQGDQWGDKIALELANIKTLPEFISPAGLGDADILKYAKQGVIIPLEDYITPELMPNLTKVFDPAVIRLAAIFAILLSFCPKFASLIGLMPAATIGGVSLILYGMISAVGVRNLIEDSVDFNSSRNVFVAALILVIAIGVKYGADDNVSIGPIHFSGLALSALVGVTLNAVLPGKLGMKVKSVHGKEMPQHPQRE